jgi:starch synthase
MNCLFVTSEVYPLIKTGGLADVSGSLPHALQQLGEDVRILLPGYRSVLEKLDRVKTVAHSHHYGQDIRILESRLPGTRVKVMLVDCPAAFDRPGNPYLDAKGQPWADNAFRFTLFCQVAVDIALNRLAFDWHVDLVHCHDWQSALVPALLSLFDERPATLFTIHNLAYQGLFDQQEYINLGLPSTLWHMHGLEYHGLFSFIKGGLVYADAISTVSPRYAQEIQSEEFGYGLAGLLAHRAERLFGILNGIDTQVWNPGTDEFLVSKYNRNNLDGKTQNKLALQQQLGLKVDASLPMFGLISRLVEQKGLEIILQAMPQLVQLPLQLVFLGSGQANYEQALSGFAEAYPDSVAVVIGYDEQLSHRIEAAADAYLMPSMFEPCGLNQLYSLRYGAIPLVTAVGGLADSVVDYSEADATGFVVSEFTAGALMVAVNRMLFVYNSPAAWTRLQLNAMAQDHSWDRSARAYLDLYQRTLAFKG